MICLKAVAESAGVSVFVDLMATVRTAVTAATVRTTGVVLAVVMVVVIAFGFGVIVQAVGEEGRYSFVCITVDAAVQLDACLSKCRLRTAPDAAANEDVCLQCRKKSCQGTVSAAVGIYNFCIYDLAVLYLIELKLCGVTEVLKDLSVFISYCNFHCTVSFSNFLRDLLNCTAKRIAVKVTAIISATGSAR